MGLNCGYIGSKPGILKLLTVILGLGALICIIIGYDKVTKDGYFRDGGAPTETSCKKNKANAKSDSIRDELKPCPETWLINITLGIVVVSLACSLILLIILLLVDLNKNGMFNQIDMILHIVGGVVQIIGAVFILAFVALALAYGAQYCDEKNTTDDEKANCRDKLWDTDFQIITFSIALGLAFFNGIIYYVTAPAIKQAQK